MTSSKKVNMENVVFTMGSSSSPRTLLEAMAWASRGWPSKLCSTRRMGCMLASLQTIKISAPLKPSVDSASTPSMPTVLCKGLYNWWLSLLLELPPSESGSARASLRSLSSSKDRRHSRKSCLLAEASGKGMFIRFSSLRSIAVSRSHGQFVAPNRTTLRALSPPEEEPSPVGQ